MAESVNDRGDREGWQQLLAMLAPDGAAAVAAYRALRRRLVDLFRWRGLAAPDDLADEALARAARRAAEGEAITDIAAYVGGVAHRLALEASRRAARSLPLPDVIVAPPVSDPGPVEKPLRQLDECLDRLPLPARQLVLRYYAGEPRIAARKRLADELGIGLNALRIRVHRLRVLLADCLNRRSGAGETEDPEPR